MAHLRDGMPVALGHCRGVKECPGAIRFYSVHSDTVELWHRRPPPNILQEDHSQITGSYFLIPQRCQGNVGINSCREKQVTKRTSRAVRKFLLRADVVAVAILVKVTRKDISYQV